MRKYITKPLGIMLIAFVVGLLPFAASADIAPLTQTGPNDQRLALLCYDFGKNLTKNNTGEGVRMLQYFLNANEQAGIDSSVWGTFDDSTMAAVKAFQQKYGFKNVTGFVGQLTRAKLKDLYGCQHSAVPMTYTNVKLTVSTITLDGNGVTATFCNAGDWDLPTAPFRVRLNGINRDFEITGAHKAGACDTESFPYSTWGLQYDAGSTFGAVTIIDPYNFYRKGSIDAPLNGATTLKVPAVSGSHLSVRGISLKSTGIQPTFCNLGTVNLTTYPVRITVNGVSKDFDVPGAYKSGQCVPVNYTYDVFGITYKQGTVYTVLVQTDPNNVIQEINEYDNSAVTVGMP